MFKSVLFIALCIVVLAECKPTEDSSLFNNENHRVARSPQHAQNAMKLAGQMANEGIQAANKGVNVLSTAMQQGISAGTSIAAEVAKSATSII